jgi:hypothetical protein
LILTLGRSSFDWALLSAVLPIAATAGCDGCGREKPYTPFGVTSSLPLIPPSAPPEPSASAAEAPKFAKRLAELAPPNATRWKIGERELEAPAGRVFAQALQADFDGDERSEVLTWTLPATPPAAPPPASPGQGELWLFRAEGAPARLFEQPGFIPIGPECQHQTALTQTGPHTVTLDVAATCKAPRVERSPVQGVAVLAPLAERPLILLLRAAAPANGETLALGVDSSDRDDDGRDDAKVTISVQKAGSARPASADVVWLDRAAGTSRDAREPSRSLARGASVEAARAKGKTTSKSVGDGVGNLRRLYATLCAEASVPRIFDADGAPLPCGDLKSMVDDLASAEMTAALMRKDYVEAAATLTRDGWYHAPMSKDRRAKLTKAFESAVTVVDVGAIVSLTAVPRKAAAPRWSPLRFQDDGSLLIQSAQAVVLVTPDGREQALGEDAGGLRWPLEVANPERVRWTGVTQPCDRAEIELSLTDAAGAPAAPLVTRLLAPRPGPCRGGLRPGPSVTAISWHAAGLEALVGGAPVGAATSAGEAALRPAQPGSPRSPDGRSMVVPTPVGLLITHEQGAELWRGDALGDARTLGDCVVANRQERVACVRDDRALLISRASAR